LRSITLDAARIAGFGDRIGSLEVGKFADVIVTTDTPLQASSAVVAEFIAGRPIELSSRHTRLDEKFRRRPAPELPARPTLRGPPAMRCE
jgi:cytosine/adenosine deaminase-related metal-dependent hydrolase